MGLILYDLLNKTYNLLNKTVAEDDAFDHHDFTGSPRQNQVLFQSIEIGADIGDVC